MNYGSSTSSWKPWRWMRLHLIFSMRNIYISSNLNPLTNFSSTSRSTNFKDILPWNISQMITKTIPISTRIIISYAMKWVSCCELVGKSMETETTTWSEFPNERKAIVEQKKERKKERKCTSVRRKKEIQKSRTMRITVWDPSRKVNHLSKVKKEKL